MKRVFYVMMVLLSINSLHARVPKKSWIHFRPHLYLGFGSVAVLSENPPVYEIIGDDGFIYPGDKVLKSKGMSFHGQARMSLIDIGPVSLGYSFWGYRHRYEDDYPEIWYGTNIVYPYINDLSLHAGCAQLNLSFLELLEGHMTPFVCAGAGPYYGSSKKVFYYEDDIYGGLWQIEIKGEKYKGLAWMAGVGAVIYRYGYAYVGITNFPDDHLPQYIFLEMIIGIKL